jgi:hypothetical protein
VPTGPAATSSWRPHWTEPAVDSAVRGWGSAADPAISRGRVRHLLPAKSSHETGADTVGGSGPTEERAEPSPGLL